MGKNKENKEKDNTSKENPKFDQSVLMEEYSQAWQHYRHLENARTKYMNFFFTALFAIIGLYSALLNLKVEIGKIQTVIGIVLILMFMMFTLYIYINVTRIGKVLKGYNGVKGRLRNLLFTKTGVPMGISVTHYLPKKKKKKIFSVQSSAQTMLLISLFFTNIFSVISISNNWNELSIKYLVTLLLILFVVLLFEIVVIIRNFKM